MSSELLPQSHYRRNLLSLVILFNLIAVPLGSILTLRRATPSAPERFLENYVFAIRSTQYWALFSPEPRREAIRYHAELRFRDGHTETWRRPYAPNWGFFQRHLSYNYQKWDLVYDFLDRRSVLWGSLVAYLLKIYRNDSNPVVEVSLVRSSAPWPPPNPSGFVGGETKDLVWTDKTLFQFDTVQGKYL